MSRRCERPTLVEARASGLRGVSPQGASEVTSRPGCIGPVSVTAESGTRPHLVPPELDELVAEYQRAERRLRETLLGDAVYSSGAVRGEEQRQAVSTQLRHLRATFDAAVRLADADAPADTLAEALRRRTRPSMRSTKNP